MHRGSSGGFSGREGVPRRVAAGAPCSSVDGGAAATRVEPESAAANAGGESAEIVARRSRWVCIRRHPWRGAIAVGRVRDRASVELGWVVSCVIAGNRFRRPCAVGRVSSSTLKSPGAFKSPGALNSPSAFKVCGRRRRWSRVGAIASSGLRAGGASYELHAACALRRVPGTRAVSDNARTGFAQVSVAAWIDSNGGFAILGDSRLCGRALLRTSVSARSFASQRSTTLQHTLARCPRASNFETDVRHGRVQGQRRELRTARKPESHTDRPIHRSPA